MSTIHPHMPHLGARLALAAILALGAAAIAVVVVVNGTMTGAQPTASPAPMSEPAFTGVTMPLTGRVVPASIFARLVEPNTPGVVLSATAWATRVERSTNTTREAWRLRRLGFTGGVDEHLYGRLPSQAEAISIVERYRTVAGAQHELAFEQTRNSGLSRTTSKTLTVLHSLGIPGAFGWVTRSGQTSAANVMFAAGPYYYLVGSGTHAGGAASPGRVIAAANYLYLMVHGCVSHHASGSPVVWSERAGRVVTG